MVSMHQSFQAKLVSALHGLLKGMKEGTRFKAWAAVKMAGLPEAEDGRFKNQAEGEGQETPKFKSTRSI